MLALDLISEDTYVLVIHSLGLQNLFFQLRKGEKRMMLSVHIMFEKFRKDFCREILSANIATGWYHLSKVGSKMFFDY